MQSWTKWGVGGLKETRISVSAIVLCLLILSGSTSVTTTETGTEISLPIADAGPDQTVFENTNVTLDGLSSLGSKGLTVFGENLMVNEAPGNDSGSRDSVNIGVDGKGVLHVFWCEFIVGKGRYVFYARSEDYGHTFQRRMVSNKSTGPYDVSCKLHAEVDSNDFIHVMWLDSSDWDNYVMYYSVSTDGGDTFRLPTPLDYGKHPMNGNMEVEVNGIIHVTFGERGEGNMFHIKSEDGGVSFGNPKRINDVEGTCFGGWIAVDMNGIIHAVYLDQRLSRPGGSDIYYSISSDGGNTFEEGVSIFEGDGIEYPMLVVDRAGNPHVVWREYGGPNYVIYYSMSNDGGESFQPRIKIAENYLLSVPRMAVGDDNLPQIVWSEWGGSPRYHSTNYTRMIEDGSFQSIVSANDGDSASKSYGANIDVDSNGTAHVVLIDDRNGKYKRDIFYARSTQGHAKIESYEWDMNNHFDSDGDGDLTNDVDATGPTPSWTYGDDGVYAVTLNVTDEIGKWDTDTVNVTVLNVVPSILDISTWVESVSASIFFRIAGEKWHNAEVFLYEDDAEIGYAEITRYPGSPNDQMVTLADISVDFSKEYSAIVHYTPEDDPVNGQELGATPAWLILRLDEDERRIHHNFNVRHPDTWTWNIQNLNEYLPVVVNIEAVAFDPGSDDLRFSWDFGDGCYEERIYYNDGSSPDPPISPEVRPITATDSTIHVYSSSSTYTITLTVEDDDNGRQSVSITVPYHENLHLGL